jgi:hypothetical protein
MAHAGLFIALPSAADAAAVRAPAAQRFLARMAGAGVGVVAVVADAAAAAPVLAALAETGRAPAAVVAMAGWNAVGLLRAGRAQGFDLAASWLVSGDAGAIAAAATAGLQGVVLVGLDPPAEDAGVVVNRADDLGDVPRVMIPRGGGCWH